MTDFLFHIHVADDPVSLQKVNVFISFDGKEEILGGIGVLDVGWNPQYERRYFSRTCNCMHPFCDEIVEPLLGDTRFPSSFQRLCFENSRCNLFQESATFRRELGFATTAWEITFAELELMFERKLLGRLFDHDVPILFRQIGISILQTTSGVEGAG